MKDFVICQDLGSGAYSKVSKVKKRDDKQEYALKKVFLSKLSEKEKENALNEVRILASVKSDNVVSYKDAFWDNSPSSLCIIMEYANDGDLYDRIKKHKKNRTRFSEAEIWKTYIQIVKGLKTLHSHKVLHRDLKCANVFLNKDGTVKLGDLNVSKVAKMGLVYTQTGTPYYASPEVWQDKPYDSKSDIWSLGVVLYEMCTLNPPFTDTSMQGLSKKVLKGIYPAIPSTYSKDLSSMVATLLQVSPTKRPSCAQILHMPSIDEHLAEEDEYEICQDLLNTIKFPRNIKHLNNRLPKSQYQSTSDVTEDVQREIEKYEAIAEIERKYTDNKPVKQKKQRQIPRTTPSSNNGISDMYSKYQDRARGMQDSIKKKNNYILLKEKYNKRAKEVAEIEKKERLLLHRRVAQGVLNNGSYDKPRDYEDRANYHYQGGSSRKEYAHGYSNSKSEDVRDQVPQLYRPVNLLQNNYRLPPTTKGLDNLSINDHDSRKANILRHARDIRAAANQNKERSTGASYRVSDSSVLYSSALPKWWG